ncbi:TetR/AcrR family transcriptional regulator [Dyella caseinilytica]|uniref:TetR/AcrR family transcriptional regulator n=1 Tax=Dyella caseinilytica TaxID=1849581 RepID=A0ABX7GUC9_9GAMM|nr:TetR/AcrR family transcriptional regulator [Dyella caseinilytica]QRN54053.1 TetR/AcrR family transcriptional regulator [Dyella caseinilytica]GFZ91231.1 putative transcriptional regulator, TetR family protein [Dyella caseinilytica]
MPVPTKRPRRSAKPPKLDLAPKVTPAQSRAAETYEHLLDVTAQVLAEVGFEQLSTNLVCQRAGLSPPALYRYFPNKYALLHELGLRLMHRQNALIEPWLTTAAFVSANALEEALTGLLLETYEVTRQATGGIWIMRALRAIPMLQDVRLESASEVAVQATARLSEAFPEVPVAELQLISRVADSMAFAALEMLFDDPSLDAPSVMRLVAASLASNVARLQGDATH